jgi:calcineurin-like phosphoesterase family protein
MNPHRIKKWRFTTMRASQGIPHGPKARLYHPELFQDHEEVIVYEREEFRRTFTNLRNNIRDILWMDLSLKSDKEYMLPGIWPLLMERVHFINLEMDSFFSGKPAQGYLDTHLFNTIPVDKEELLESLSNTPSESLSLEWL